MDLIERGAANPRHPWETSRIKAVERILRTYSSPTASILDIGCGDGFMLKCLSQQKGRTDLHGVDIKLTADKAAAMSRGPVTFHHSLNEIKRPFDIILLMDVLEHVKNDVDFLRKIIKSQTHTKTLFLITVPAFQSISCGHDVFLKHFRRYNRRQLVQKLRDTGLEPQSHGSFFATLLLPRMLQCLAEKTSHNKHAPTGIGCWNGSPRFTRFIETLFNIDNTALWYLNRLGIRAPGLSLWTTAGIKQ